MPITTDTLESIQTTEEVVKEFIPDPTNQYWFFRKLSLSLNFDAQSRVTGFASHLTHYRRETIKKMFHGDNIDEIARKLDIKPETVKNDLRWIEENRKTQHGKKV